MKHSKKYIYFLKGHKISTYKNCWVHIFVIHSLITITLLVFFFQCKVVSFYPLHSIFILKLSLVRLMHAFSSIAHSQIKLHHNFKGLILPLCTCLLANDHLQSGQILQHPGSFYIFPTIRAYFSFVQR